MPETTADVQHGAAGAGTPFSPEIPGESAGTGTVGPGSGAPPKGSTAKWLIRRVTGLLVVLAALFVGLLILQEFLDADPVANPLPGIASWWSYMTQDIPTTVRDRTLEHARLVLQSVLIASVLAVGMGIAAHRWRVLQAPLLGMASVFLTIPSLALFSLFIPVVGLGSRPVMIALVMYALLPIMRNTVTGLEGVDAAVAESARGMGFTKFQTLLRVELPLAWPVISTGIRVSLLLSTGIAAIATLVNGGGLGDLIYQGLRRTGFPNAVEQVWTGTALTVGLALLFDAIFGLFRHFTTPRGIRS